VGDGRDARPAGAGALPPLGGWSLTIADYSDVPGAAGYHWVGEGHVPFGKAFAKEGIGWQLVFTHELFEILGDPFCDRFTNASRAGHNPAVRQRFLALETGDPVEDAAYAYTRPGADGAPVVISDFVTERWFDGQGGGRFDFTGHARHALQVLPGGYVISFESGHWNFGVRKFLKPLAGRAY
jgi:hypothetical protein